MDLHFVREKMDRGDVRVEHIPGKKQRSYILTKALKPGLYQDLRFNLVGELPAGRLRGTYWNNR